MFLYLVQHAEAKKEEEDPVRPLSKRGNEDIKNVAAYASRLNIRVSQILHSEKIRAIQTAHVLAEYLMPEKGVTETTGLDPRDSPEVWGKRLSKMTEDLMLVGHLPHLAGLASLLLCGDPNKTTIDFKMGGIVCLKRFEDGHWGLEWIITPEVIP